MKGLIWKELIEVKWWAALLMGVPPLSVLFGYPALSFRHGAFDGIGLGCWLGGGLLIGALALSRELAWDTARFAHSRPIRWWHLWLAKFTVGVMLCASSAALTVLVYRLTCHRVYLPFADLTMLATGFIQAFTAAFVPFVVGFGLSGVRPGLSLTVTVGCAAAAGLAVVVYVQVDVLHRTPNAMTPMIMITCFAASLAVARCLTHPVATRTRRFTMVVVAGLALEFVVSLPSPASRRYTWFTEMSPDRNSIVNGEFTDSGESAPHYLRLTDPATRTDSVVERAHRVIAIGWSPDSRNFLYLSQLKTEGDITLMALDTTTRRARVLARLPTRSSDMLGSYQAWGQRGQWSPDAQRVLFVVRNLTMKNKVTMSTCVFDRQTHALRRLPYEPGFQEVWWLNRDTIAVDDIKRGNVIAFDVRSGASREVLRTR